METKNQILKNMVFSLIAFIINIGISFFLSSYIINNIGAEANGFVSLANNVVNYASILVIALNSMASRYVSIAIYEKNYKNANEYFNSVLFSNILISLILIIPSIFMIVFLERIFNINVELILNVKILFSLVFINFFINLINTAFSISTFSAERLDMSAKRNAISYIIRALILILLFGFLKPNIIFVGISSLIATIYILISNITFTKELTPYIKINKDFIKIKKIIEITKSGIWNVITKLGQILTDGLDLLISNIFINAYAMGLLAISKTILTAILTMISTVSQVFQPRNTKYYAEKDKSMMLENIKSSMKITGFFANIPLVFLLVCGYSFYSLWVPGQDIRVINILSILSVLALLVGGVIDPLWNIFTITNKLKTNSFVILGTGLLNTLIVFILIKNTNLGIYAIAGVSSITAIIKNLTFTPMYASKCIKTPMKEMYKIIFRYLLVTAFACLLLYPIHNMINPNAWIKLILCGIIGVGITCILNYLFLFDKSEKDLFKNKITELIDKFKKKPKDRDLYFCLTYYHLLITISKTLHSTQKTDLLISTKINNVKTLTERLEKIGLFENIILIDDKNIECDKSIKDIHIILNKRKLKRIIEKIINVSQYTNIYLFNDWSAFGEYLQTTNKKYHLLEDGEDCYKNIDFFIDDINCQKLSSKIKNWLNIGCNPYGKSNCVLDIEVNDLNGIKITNKKIIENNKEKLFKTLTNTEIDMILNIFDIKIKEDIKTNSILIITQPLYEDRLVKSEKEHIEIYKSIIKEYSKQRMVYIKPHPRDNVNYKKHFKETIIIDKNFPIEILNYVDNISFEEGITISSTSINNLKIIKNKTVIGFDFLKGKVEK